jgi:hypothetical protein
MGYVEDEMAQVAASNNSVDFTLKLPDDFYANDNNMPQDARGPIAGSSPSHWSEGHII